MHVHVIGVWRSSSQSQLWRLLSLSRLQMPTAQWQYTPDAIRERTYGPRKPFPFPSWLQTVPWRNGACRPASRENPHRLLGAGTIRERTYGRCSCRTGERGQPHHWWFGEAPLECMCISGCRTKREGENDVRRSRTQTWNSKIARKEWSVVYRALARRLQMR